MQYLKMGLLISLYRYEESGVISNFLSNYMNHRVKQWIFESSPCRELLHSVGMPPGHPCLLPSPSQQRGAPSPPGRRGAREFLRCASVRVFLSSTSVLSGEAQMPAWCGKAGVAEPPKKSGPRAPINVSIDL